MAALGEEEGGSATATAVSTSSGRQDGILGAFDPGNLPRDGLDSDSPGDT